MPFGRRNHLLPLWDSGSSTIDTDKPEEEQMILVSVPPALESALRAVVRCVVFGVVFDDVLRVQQTRCPADERPLTLLRIHGGRLYAAC